MIISGGSNAYEREGEEALLGSTALPIPQEVGVPHPKWRERVAAPFVSSSGEPVFSVILDDRRCAEPACSREPIRFLGCEAWPTNRCGNLFKRNLCARHARVP